ncbi:hypothetical protein ABEX69_18235 [Bacillus safensis]|uniref:response regulator aspartate phosphatase n=1 Tax=Bacillus safensis TaxID=561879 RepID=UPI00227E414E|nr:hypothetical protein [Bacillus safensis]MCY7566561.1 hypothetical protein [Bacillus safensis]MCY7626139.1 hypothetical protein [Bacillus safensis]MCY7634879.1 hypothetical protein [Bacillus safensis]MCY7650110.1 hypothetical protein [Bacillus safensis]MCY7651505.1 hypothetical protein [Bacillus safensis]
MEKVLSSQVGILINDWYRFIRTFSVPDAEILKEQVEREIENMKEDQDLLLYYQLMEFRHRLMLESLEPIENESTTPHFNQLTQRNREQTTPCQRNA